MIGWLVLLSLYVLALTALGILLERHITQTYAIVRALLDVMQADLDRLYQKDAKTKRWMRSMMTEVESQATLLLEQRADLARCCGAASDDDAA